MGGLSELSALSECHYYFITRYSIATECAAGCTQSGSTFICKQHDAEGAASQRRSIIFHSYHNWQTYSTV